MTASADFEMAAWFAERVDHFLYQAELHEERDSLPMVALRLRIIAAVNRRKELAALRGEELPA